MANIPTGRVGERNDLKDLFARVAKLEADAARRASSAAQFEAMTIAKGGLEVSGGGGINVDGGSINVSGGGDFTITDADGNLIWDALSSPLKIASTQVDVEDAGITTSWSTVGSKSIAIPKGYTSGQVMMFVSAGLTYDGTTGNVSVQPVLWDQYGPGINSGDGSICVANSFVAFTFANTSHTTVDLSVQAIRAAGALNGNSNAHLSASVIFTR